MRFALLIYADAREADETSLEEAQRELAVYDRITEEMVEEGVMVFGEVLVPGSQARQVSQGLVSQGSSVHPDPELSGFYIIDCDSLDDAQGWATKLPATGHGVVEVRPVFDEPRDA